MTETMDAAGLGRGRRMSRQRKRYAVLRLLRGEDIETVTRALGITAATLSGWREAFLAAGEASLATRSIDGEALESQQLKVLLARCCSSASCWRSRSQPWRAVALWPARGHGHEPDRLAHRRQAPMAWPGMPGLARSPGHDLPPSSAASGGDAEAAWPSRANAGSHHGSAVREGRATTTAPSSRKRGTLCGALT